MASEEVLKKLDNLTLNSKKEINILLLGETGAGKSTFINSVVNYLQFESFQKAEVSSLEVLINAIFPIEDRNGKMHMVEVGNEDKNEYLKTGASATQCVKTYSFRIRNGNVLVRLIDTPGMGDTRGMEQDQENCENILNYLNRLHQLHAICYLAKTQQSRSTVYFEYCVMQILSRLEKSACKNIVFIFTHGKGSNYSAGDTIQLFQEVAEKIKKNPAHAELKVDQNTFCFDNEAFKTLAALQKGIELSPMVKKSSVESWNRSSKQCWNMINYILDLPPHLVKQTTAINEARRLIYQLSQPMADIAQLINVNIQVLQNHNNNMDIQKRSLDELKKKLYIPIIDLKVTNLTQPVTVCADISCSEVYDVGEKKEWHYKTRCHDPCYLTNVPRDIMGSPELINCASMGGDQVCKKCRHSYKVHMHVYYMTEKTHTKRVDDVVSKHVNTQESIINAARNTIWQVEQLKAKHQRELDTIIKCNAKFAHFLQHNAIAPFSDSYAEYIRYLREKERSLGNNADLAKLAGLDKLYREHEEMKKIFHDAAEMQKKLGRPDTVTPQDISDSKKELFALEVNGEKIKELFNSQKNSMKKEYTFSEYQHKGVFQQSTPTDKLENKPDYKKGPSSASNPTQKFQRGRPNTRGNQQRGRSKSTSRTYQRRNSSSEPPSYEETVFDYPRDRRRPTDYRYPPPPPADYRYPPAPPPPADYRYNHGPPPPRPHPADGYYDHQQPRAEPHPYADNQPTGKQSTIQLNVTLPTNPPPGDSRPEAAPRRPPPSDYSYHSNPPYGRDPYYDRDPYYRPAPPYPYPYDPYHYSRHPSDYDRRREEYPYYDARYDRVGPSANPQYHRQNDPPAPARPRDNNYPEQRNYRQNDNGSRNTHRGRGRGGISRNKPHRRTNNTDQSASGNDSDSSVKSRSSTRKY